MAAHYKSAFQRAAVAACFLAGALGVAAPRAAAQLSDPVQRIGVRPDLLTNVGIDQKLNQQIPLDLTFRDENGKPVQIGKYFGQKPVVLSLVYYDCPMLCTQVLSGMEASLRNISLNIGSDFNVVTVSIDPHEDAKLAHVKQELYNRRVRPPRRFRRLALPHRRRAGRSSSSPTRSASATLRRGLQAIRARQHHHGADARRQNFEVFLRHHLPVARSALGWSKRPKAKSERRWMPRCCSATTTIRPPGNTACWYRA